MQQLKNGTPYALRYEAILYLRTELSKEVIETLTDSLQVILHCWDCELNSLGYNGDHIFFTFTATPKIQPSKLIGSVKNQLDNRLLQQFQILNAQHRLQATLWHPLYGIRSIESASTAELRTARSG